KFSIEMPNFVSSSSSSSKLLGSTSWNLLALRACSISMTEGCLGFGACSVKASSESSREHRLVAWWERKI
ncbi:hypothetical protein PanWU01x14_233720, partial [Parasponia andersonii]